jgi:WhiB family transcriptional regulator, redox-sensing transcriptional regulator
MPFIDTDEAIFSFACALVSLDLHFPKKGRKDQVKEAKQVCSGCVMRESCLKGALEREEPWGVWGGTTKLERKALQRERKKNALLSATA